ncbi:MAG: gamma-glutamyltransferase family protein [Thalassobaculales bacterium]
MTSSPRIAQHRDFFRPGRSPVHGLNGMASTSHPLATAAAVDVLRRGGNAVDAAVAAVAVLCVVEPGQTGIGGDCFWLLAPAGAGKVLSYNGSGTAPQAASVATLKARLGAEVIPSRSPHAVTVPGTIDGWDHIVRQHGTKPLAELLEYAIAYAADGFPLQARIQQDITGQAEKIREDAGLSGVFLKDGAFPAPGSLIRNPALAESLRKIARDGRAAYYEGPIGRSLAAFLAAKGGLHTADDFARHRGMPTTPIHARFQGYDVFECPPNGQGIIALMIMRMLEHLGPVPEGPGSGQRLHQLNEAARIAFACRDAYLCDPAQGGDPWAAFLDDRWTGPQARSIPADRMVDLSGRTEIPVHADTTYLCVVDGKRNAVSFINSLFDGFGSGMMDPETGIVLHNRGQSFRLIEGHPNAIAPGKRPMHTIIPGMLLRDGRAVMPFGVMGGHFQPVGHAMLLANLFHYGMDLQAAIDHPRIYPLNGTLWVEPTVDAAAVAHLKALGHPVDVRGEPVGGSQAIWIDPATGILTGGSDSRKDGCALGF